MNFPKIENYSQVERLIWGNPNFNLRQYEDLGLTFICYGKLIDKDAFPEIKTEEDKIFRELRGIAFDESGKVVSRPLHKFFNVGEREETLPENIDWKDYRIFTKIDGSMVRPIMAKTGKMIWATKGGISDVGNLAGDIAKFNQNIIDFANLMIENELTPIFELTTPKQRIVIDYGNEDKLTLLTIRHNITGQYLSHGTVKELGARHDIPVVNEIISSMDSSTLMEHTRSLKGEEGYVALLSNGQRVKIKGEEYCLIHKILERLEFEKDAIEICLSGMLDDIKSFLKKEIVKSLEEFNDALHKALIDSADKISDLTIQLNAKSEGRKEFAEQVKKLNDPSLSGMIFTCLNLLEKNGEDKIHGIMREFVPTTVLKKYVNSASKVEQGRFLFPGIYWKDFYNNAMS